MKTILKLAALAIVALTVLTSCTAEQENFTEPAKNATTDRNKTINDNYNLGFDLSELEYYWSKVPGNIARISLDGKGNVYGYGKGSANTNTYGYFYKWDGSLSWKQFTSAGLDFSTFSMTDYKLLTVSEDGNSIWYLTQKLDGNSWLPSITTHLPTYRYITKTSAGNNDQLWITDDGWNAYQWRSNSWKKESSYYKFREVACSPKGDYVYMIDRENYVYRRVSDNEWERISDIKVKHSLNVSDNGDVWAINDYDFPVKSQGRNWLVMGPKMSSIAVSPDGKEVWGTKVTSQNLYDFETFRFRQFNQTIQPPANNPNNKFTKMNRALMDSTLKCFGKSNWQAQIANFNTVAGKTAIRDLYVGAYDQAIAKGTLNRFANLFAGGIGGTEYNNFVTSMRAVTLQSMNISLELTPPPSAVLLSPAADALQKEIINWRGNGVEEDGAPYPGYYTLTDLRNFLTTENSKIATANITEVERNMLYGMTALRWDVATYYCKSEIQLRAMNAIGIGDVKVDDVLAHFRRLWQGQFDALWLGASNTVNEFGGFWSTVGLACTPGLNVVAGSYMFSQMLDSYCYWYYTHHHNK